MQHITVHGGEEDGGLLSGTCEAAIRHVKTSISCDDWRAGPIAALRLGLRGDYYCASSLGFGELVGRALALALENSATAQAYGLPPAWPLPSAPTCELPSLPRAFAGFPSVACKWSVVQTHSTLQYSPPKSTVAYSPTAPRHNQHSLE